MHFWIWKNNLPGILRLISDMCGYDLDQSNMDEIKYGLFSTSDEKGFWFEYQLSKTTIKLALDEEDRDIVFIQLIGDLNYDLSNLLSRIGTDFEIKPISRIIE